MGDLRQPPESLSKPSDLTFKNSSPGPRKARADRLRQNERASVPKAKERGRNVERKKRLVDAKCTSFELGSGPPGNSERFAIGTKLSTGDFSFSICR